LLTLQAWPGLHWAAVEHAVQQANPLQVKGVQSFFGPGLHAPMPSHFPAPVTVDPVQVSKPQGVPGTWRRQPPLPLQPPALPQVKMFWMGQSFFGSCMSATGVQVPADPATLQA
jgi:hypothetical protein